MVNVIMNEIMDHGPRVGFDDIGQHRPGAHFHGSQFTKQGPDLQNILQFIVRLSWVYRKIDLTMVTYNMLEFLLGIS